MWDFPLSNSLLCQLSEAHSFGNIHMMNWRHGHHKALQRAALWSSKKTFVKYMCLWDLFLVISPYFL